MDDLARVPLSFPTYAGILGRAAYRAAEQLSLQVGGEGGRNRGLEDVSSASTRSGCAVHLQPKCRRRFVATTDSGHDSR